MKNMKYFKREITKREAINSFGRIGYPVYYEIVKTNDITPFNKGKRIYFWEISKEDAKKIAGNLKKIKKDNVYSFEK